MFFAVHLPPGLPSQERITIQPTREFIVPPSLVAQRVMAASAFSQEIALAVSTATGRRVISYDAANFSIRRSRVIGEEPKYMAANEHGIALSMAAGNRIEVCLYRWNPDESLVCLIQFAVCLKDRIAVTHARWHPRLGFPVEIYLANGDYKSSIYLGQPVLPALERPRTAGIWENSDGQFVPTYMGATRNSIVLVDLAGQAIVTYDLVKAGIQ